MLALQAQALGDENAQLRTYIGRLEQEQRSLAAELVGWQGKWKSAAASNRQLYHQLLSTQQCESSLINPVSALWLRQYIWRMRHGQRQIMPCVPAYD